MREIHIKPLDRDNFHKYGDYYDLFDLPDADPGRSSQFFPDLMTMRLHDRGATGIGISLARPCPMIIERVEIHQYAGEGLLPLDGDCVVFVGKQWRELTSDHIEAFLVPKGTFITFRPGVVHGRQFAAGDAPVHVMVLLPERTYYDDAVPLPLEIEAQIKIVG